MDKEHSGTQKETFTMDSSRMIWPTAPVNTGILMDPSTKENSSMTFRKDMAKKNGWMEPSMLVNTLRV